MEETWTTTAFISWILDLGTFSFRDAEHTKFQRHNAKCKNALTPKEKTPAGSLTTC